MATTTPNYGWDVPTSTDYVKDGAVAIETLGDDIDASLFSITGGKNVGLVHLHTTDTTSTTAINVDSIFTSAYKNYRIVVTTTATNDASSIMVMKLRASGATIAGTSYKYALQNCSTTGSTSTSVANSGDNWLLSYIASANGNNGFIIDLCNPQINTRTTATMQMFGYDGSFLTRGGGFMHDAVQQADGMRLEIDGGSTFTYTLQIFGYRNS